MLDLREGGREEGMMGGRAEQNERGREGREGGRAYLERLQKLKHFVLG